MRAKSEMTQSKAPIANKTQVKAGELRRYWFSTYGLGVRFGRAQKNRQNLKECNALLLTLGI